MRKAKAAIVQSRPDLAMGEYYQSLWATKAVKKASRVSLTRNANGAIVVPKKKKDESAAERVARQAAQIGAQLEEEASLKAAGPRVTHGAASESVEHDENGEILAQKKGDRRNEHWAFDEDRTGCTKKTQEGAFMSTTHRPSHVGPVVPLLLGTQSALKDLPERPPKSSMPPCLDCAGTRANSNQVFQWALKSDNTWVLLCHSCYNGRYLEVWTTDVKRRKWRKDSYSTQGKIDNIPN